MRIFDKDDFDELDEMALQSDRKRSHLNLHGSYDEKVQRLFISLLKGSYVEPHYHELPHQWEIFVVVEGVVEVTIYNTDGSEIERLLVGEGQSCKVVEIAPMDIHSVRCISDKALMLEVKEGPFCLDTAKVRVDFDTCPYEV